MVAEERTCRLCWGDEDDGPLVQPCACCGSAKWIHEHCLEQWRRTGSKEDAAYRCGQCMNEYRDALSVELLSARPQAKRTNGKDTSSTEYDKAEPLCREVAEVTRATLASMSDHGVLLHAKGDLAAAEPLFRKTLKVASKTYGRRHPDTLRSIGNLGALLQDKGDLAAAEPLCREALEGSRETLGNHHPHTLISIGRLGSLLKAKGDFAAAELLLREALAGQRETLGDQHPDTLSSIKRLDRLLQAKGKLRPAERLYATARRWLCVARRSAVGIRARLFAQRRASVAPSVGCS